MAEVGWSSSPILIKILIVSTLVSFVILIIGYSTPLWVSASGRIPVIIYGLKGPSYNVYLDHLGLWHACGGDHGCIAITTNISAWMGATRAFESMGLIALFVALICIVLFVFIPNFAGNGRLEIAIMVSSFVASGLIILGVIIFGAEVKYNLNFSFAMCCIAGILCALNGGLVVLHKCCR